MSKYEKLGLFAILLAQNAMLAMKVEGEYATWLQITTLVLGSVVFLLGGDEK